MWWQPGWIKNEIFNLLSVGPNGQLYEKIKAIEIFKNDQIYEEKINSQKRLKGQLFNFMAPQIRPYASPK